MSANHAQEQDPFIDNLQYSDRDTVNSLIDHDQNSQTNNYIPMTDEEDIQRTRKVSEEEIQKHRRQTFLIFLLLWLCYCIGRFDQGIIPALNTTLKDEFNLTNVEMGTLGSCVYLGQVIGSLIGMPMFNYWPTKFILVVCLLAQIASLFIFTQTSDFSSLSIARCITGITQVQLAIAFPIWVDRFGPAHRRSLWMTALSGGVGLGMIFGYLTAAMLEGYASWHWAFYIQIILIIPLTIAVLFIPVSKIELSQQFIDDLQVVEQLEYTDDSNPNEPEVINTEQMSMFEIARLERLRTQEEQFRGLCFTDQIKFVLKTTNFTLIMMGMTSIFMILSGVQFWVTDYYVQVLLVTPANAYKIYGTVGLIGPGTGIIATGIIFNRIGGYSSEHALSVCSIFATLMVTSCVFTLIVDKALTVGFFVCMELFCLSFQMPVLTGVMITQVPVSAQTLANSIANLCFNLFGYLPAPLLYGCVYEYTGAGQSRYGLASIQIFSVILLIFVLIVNYRQKKELEILKSQDFQQVQSNQANLQVPIRDQEINSHLRRARADSYDVHDSLISPFYNTGQELIQGQRLSFTRSLLSATSSHHK